MDRIKYAITATIKNLFDILREIQEAIESINQACYEKKSNQVSQTQKKSYLGLKIWVLKYGED